MRHGRAVTPDTCVGIVSMLTSAEGRNALLIHSANKETERGLAVNVARRRGHAQNLPQFEILADVSRAGKRAVDIGRERRGGVIGPAAEAARRRSLSQDPYRDGKSSC